MQKIKEKWQDFKQYINTDRFYFDAFLSQIGVLLMITVFVLTYGNPERMSKGFNSDHQACGVDLGVKEYPFIYFATPNPQYLYRTVCVKECPFTHSQQLPTQIECRPNSVVPNCHLSPSIFNMSNQFLIYNSMPYKNNICVPNMLQFYNQVKDGITPPAHFVLVHDLYYSKWIAMLLGPLVAFITTNILMVVIDHYYKCIMWFFIFGTLAALGISGIQYMQEAVSVYQANQPQVAYFHITDDFMEDSLNKQNYMLSLFFGILFVILFFLCCYQLNKKFSRTKNLLGILKLTDQFMELPENRKLKQFSFILFLVLIVLFGCTFFLTIQLLSCAADVYAPNLQPFEQLQPTVISYFLSFLIIFMFAWQFQFILTCAQFTTISSIIKWFNEKVIKEDTDNITTDYVKKAARELLLKVPEIAHLSFLILTLNPIKVVVDTLLDQIKYMSEGRVKQKLQQWTQPLKRMYEKHLRSIENVVLVEVINKGKPLNEARQDFLKTLQDQKHQEFFEEQGIILRIYSGNLCMFFYLAGSIFVAFQMIVLAKTLFTVSSHFRQLLYSSMQITIICGIMGFVVSALYLTIYGVSGQTFIYLHYRYKKKESKSTVENYTHRIEHHFKSLYELVLTQQDEDKDQEQN